MRTRSHPVSPGGLVSLDDVPAPPTRRRNTRSVSAQPQDAAEPGSGAAEATKPKPTPKTRKTRAKSTRGKKTNRRPTKSAEPEQKDATGIAAEQVNQDDIETSHEDHEMHDEHSSLIPSIEDPQHSIFTSVETGDAENGTGNSTASHRRNFARRNAQTSPSRATSNTHRASRGSQVLAPQKATPIRRSYSSISQTRRTEASGRINRTLYRLPDLVTHDDSDEDAPVQDRHQVVDTEENVSVIANPTTPEPARPMTPMTAPPAANVGDTAATPNSSPSWSRWIFNSVSRRWTNIRERLVPRPSAGTLSAAEADETVEADEAIDQIATPTKSAETNKAPSTAPKLPTETFVPLPTRSTYRRRVSTFLPHDIDPDRPRRPRRISTTDRPVAAPKPLRKPTTPAAELGYDLFPRGYDEQLLNKWFARGTNPRHAQPSQATNDMQATNKASISAPNQVVPTTNETASALTEDQSLKRKREEPEKIPNPKGCSYGLSEEFFEFTDAEWEEEEKRVAALKANESAQPAAKKQRVDASQPRRRATTRPSSSNAHPSTLSPARRPGFVPNRRGTYAAPDLSPIESSGLLSGVDSTPTREASSEGPASAQYDHDSTDHEALQQQREIKAKQPRGPNPRPSVFANPNDVPDSGQTAPTVTQNLELPAATTPEREPSHTDTDIDIDIDADADGPSPLTRARNKAEQFKPKTPSRLREAHPFSSSIASAATASPSFLGVATGTPLNFGATLQTPSNLGALNSSHAFYSDPMSIDSIEPATPADDANWLRETCPTGEIAKLCWPEPASLAETLGIDPAIAEFVNQHVNPEKDAEAVAAWQTMFEEFQRGELEI